MSKLAPDVLISHALVRDTKQYDATRANFKAAIAGLIDKGHTVAAFESAADQPSIVFKDSESFLYWYENFYRIQGWFTKRRMFDSKSPASIRAKATLHHVPRLNHRILALPIA